MALRPDYISVDDMRAQARIDDVDDDAELALAITSASRAVDRYCNRQFGLAETPTARAYTAWWNPDIDAWQVDLFDLSTDDIVVTAGEITITAAGYRLGPLNAEADGLPYTELVFTSAAEATPSCAEGDVVVTGVWGWLTIPDPVKQATKLQAARFVKRRDAPFGIAGSVDLGSEMRLLSKLDPDVAVALAGPNLCRPRLVG